MEMIVREACDARKKSLGWRWFGPQGPRRAGGTNKKGFPEEAFFGGLAGGPAEP
jgi:hypothetical protein